MGGNLSKDTVHVIARIVKYEDEEFTVKLMPVQYQTNDNDCGLFALAFDTNFAEGNNPSEGYFDEKIYCKKPSTAMFQFPQKDMSLKSKPSKIVYKVYVRYFAYTEMFSSWKK